MPFVIASVTIFIVGLNEVARMGLVGLTHWQATLVSAALMLAVWVWLTPLKVVSRRETRMQVQPPLSPGSWRRGPSLVVAGAAVAVLAMAASLIQITFLPVGPHFLQTGTVLTWTLFSIPLVLFLGDASFQACGRSVVRAAVLSGLCGVLLGLPLGWPAAVPLAGLAAALVGLRAMAVHPAATVLLAGAGATVWTAVSPTGQNQLAGLLILALCAALVALAARHVARAERSLIYA